jgi:GH25 family lysozyme M1 (1,4-beta-N-acetylmuramidase)
MSSNLKEPTWLIDVSEHQGPNVDFRQVRGEGYEGAIAKMSEGTGYVDPTGAGNLKHIISSDLTPGAYHFLWGGLSARKQAQFFLQQVSRVVEPENVALFVDVEISDNMAPSQHPTFQDVQRFLKTLEEKLPASRLGIYSGYYWRDHMSNPPIRDLGLKLRPIIWDAHYFTTQVDYGSVLYRSVPASYWEEAAFGGRKADILQFASTGRLRQFPEGIDVNACPRGLESLTGASEGKEGNNGTIDRWRPQLKSGSLVPPGFERVAPIRGSAIYSERHPTRYRFAEHNQPLIRALYRELGGPEVIHINTYLDHPEGYHRTLDSFDVWGPGGRGDPLPFDVGEEAFKICWEWKGLPNIEWCIYRRKIYSVRNNYLPEPFGDGSVFMSHDDHYHQTSQGR